ncbi:syntaxin-3-like [Sabethes cyaneus]|uniref:syntaxin-3-like n=1 Tax=Sabethes cyaneus TaxID=53552 RepID=UPI00237E4B2B|nr:syntaxin-3-like [Sabethes cyaneus]
MTKDRLSELLEKSAYKDFEYKFVQEHEFWTLYNQERILEDLDRFSDIAGWIRRLQLNVLEVEVNIFSEGFSKAESKLRENADLCYQIYTAVKHMQTELQNQQWREEEEVVSRVRSVQFERIKEAYLKAYWKYQAVVRRFEESIDKNGFILYSNEDYEDLQEYIPTKHLLQQETTSVVSQETVDEARNTLNALENRHHDLQLLEQSLVQMRDLFVLFSTLVMEHGSLLNLIEGNVQTASDHVAVAVQELGAAREYQWKTTGQSCFCFKRMGFLLVVLAVLTVIVIILVVKKLVL